MRIQSVAAKSFKRFANLEITGIPQSARLVVLLGPNGSGKSSLIELFNSARALFDEVGGYDRAYYAREQENVGDITLAPKNHIRAKGGGLLQGARMKWYDALEHCKIQCWGQPPIDWLQPGAWPVNRIHIRGAHRVTPRHSSNGLVPESQLDSDKIDGTIVSLVDSRLDAGYQRLVHHSIKEVTNPGDRDDLTVSTAAMKPLRRLQEAVSRVFPGLELEGLGQPTKQGTFVFKKGKSRGWPVNNLSAGEKSAFELLLDLGSV